MHVAHALVREQIPVAHRPQPSRALEAAHDTLYALFLARMATRDDVLNRRRDRVRLQSVETKQVVRPEQLAGFGLKLPAANPRQLLDPLVGS